MRSLIVVFVVVAAVAAVMIAARHDDQPLLAAAALRLEAQAERLEQAAEASRKGMPVDEVLGEARLCASLINSTLGLIPPGPNKAATVIVAVGAGLNRAPARLEGLVRVGAHRRGSRWEADCNYVLGELAELARLVASSARDQARGF